MNETTLTVKQHPLQNVLVVLLDQSDTDDQNIFLQLRNVVNEVNLFKEADECIDYITDYDDMKTILIIEESLGRQILSSIHDLPQIHSIYIFCHEKSDERQWITSEKVKSTHTEITSICESLQQIMKRFNQDSIPMSFITADEEYSPQSLNELEPTFMYTQLLKEILLEMKYNEQAIKNFTTYCRNGNHGSPKNITRFENEYNPQSAIWWYTYPSFIYSLLNTALRTLQTDTIIETGFFIHDLHQQIKQLHQEQTINSEKKSFIVYRGQGFSNSDFKKLQNAKGGLLSFNNFLSTSGNQDISLQYAFTASTATDTIGILFRMSIDSSISSSAFADVKDVGFYHDDEEEILFSMHTIFRIGEIKPIGDNNSLYQVDLQLTADDDQQLRTLTDYLRKELANSTGWTKLAALLHKTGHFDKAEELLNILVEQTSDETERITHYNSLGCLRAHQGDYEKAICYYKKGLEFAEENSSSPDVLDLTSLYNNLGAVYTYMKQLKNALLFYEKSLQIGQKYFPPNHPNLAYCYNNMGEVFKKMGEYSEAFSHYKKALEIREISLPKNHPDLPVSYGNIGMMYEHMGEYSKAFSYLKKSLEIKQRILPKDHPDFAFIYRNIGIVLIRMGEYVKAISFYKKAIDIEEKVYDANHPNLAVSYNNIGEAYQNNGEFSNALAFLFKSMKIREKNHSSMDDDLATTYNNICTVYSELGEYESAILYFKKAMDIREKILPPNHLDLGQSYNNIAAVFYKLKDYHKALLYYEKALKIVQINLPPYHPLVSTCYDNIGSVYNSMMEYTKALSFYKQAIDIRQQTMPQDHPDFGKFFNNIASVYGQLGDYSNAITYYQRALHILQRLLPTNHPNIIIIQQNIKILQRQM